MKEKDLLARFLVGNELHDSVTLQQFKSSFPASYQSHPEVKHLYRAYLNARHQVRTKVRRNIDIEVKRNPFNLDIQHGSDVDIQGSSRAEHDMDSTMSTSDDMDIEDTDKHLTLDQAIQELAQAERIYRSEIENLEAQCNEFTRELEDLDREMDTVRIPKGSWSGIDDEQQVMKELQNLIQLCDSVLDSTSPESHT
ncbi:hypothetical protein B0O80DRAFT_493208 [Mortierella sp. GBAus27b]|nr:hypothetical protein BGX31_010094 [Mortierella sp. GBA43]KAI8362194.1 hypothetical protein B0O80DRAFT_493208 [Mortierella sp. GBAus27b]